MSRLVAFLQRFALTSWYWRLWIHAESAAERLLPFWWVPEDRAWWPKKKVIVVHRAAMPAAASVQVEQPSATSGMNLGQRIAHVGGRTNAAGYVEFGSEMAVDALIRHVLRDLRATPSSASPAGEREALTLAANRLDRLALDQPFGSRRQFEVTEWAGEARAALATHQLAEQKPVEPLTRFCPSCGSVGPVDAKYHDCCPDGFDARMIPEKLAAKCRDLFYAALDAAPQPEQVAQDRLAWLHSPASCNVDGYEWGVFRVKWENGAAADVQHTYGDFSDLDAAMARQKVGVS